MASAELGNSSVILSAAKNLPSVLSETLRFAQGDKELRVTWV